MCLGDGPLNGRAVSQQCCGIWACSIHDHECLREIPEKAQHVIFELRTPHGFCQRSRRVNQEAIDKRFDHVIDSCAQELAHFPKSPSHERIVALRAIGSCVRRFHDGDSVLDSRAALRGDLV